MTDEIIKAMVGKFVKKMTFTAQREIERSIRNALASGKLKGHQTFTAGVALRAEKIELDITLYSTIELT